MVVWWGSALDKLEKQRPHVVMSEITTALSHCLLTVMNSKCLPIPCVITMQSFSLFSSRFKLWFWFHPCCASCVFQRLRGSWCQRQWQQVLWRPSPQRPCSSQDNYWGKRALLGCTKALVPPCSGKTHLAIVLTTSCNKACGGHLSCFSVL